MPIELEFQKIFGASPERVIRAPGRVNLIGEHTDYNDGFVLPMAIDRAMQIAARQRNDRIIRVVALDFDGARVEFSLDAPIERDAVNKWSNYVRGIAWMMQRRGLPLVGLDLVMRGNVPIGSGLSSSAALDVASALTFNTFGNLGLDGRALARLCQQADNEFVGIQCGIMDQFISALAQAGHALLIDCRDLTYQNVPLPQGVTIVVCDTMKRRGLVDSDYNARRAECERGVEILREVIPGITALRDVRFVDFLQYQDRLPVLVRRRCRHVISENERTLAAARALESGALDEMGRLMNASHDSLRDDYEVSCRELDVLVEAARSVSGVAGARMTGAGFGGCTVNLVKRESLDRFHSTVTREYSAATGLTPEIFAVKPSDGASEVT
jgi:galactokinase